MELSYIVGGKGEMDMRHIGFRNKVAIIIVYGKLLVYGQLILSFS